MFGNILKPDALENMSADQILSILDKFNIDIPRILQKMETGILTAARKAWQETGKKVMLVAEPSDACDHIKITIYEDQDGYGDLRPLKEFPFTQMLDLLKPAEVILTPNITIHETPQTKQIGPAGDAGGFTANDPTDGATGSAVGPYQLTGAGDERADIGS